MLKLSGEALAGDKKTGFDEATVLGIARQVKELSDEGIQIGIVTGGGNFWRGRSSENMDRTKADQIGNAGDSDELHLCFGDVPFNRASHTRDDAFCLRLLYGALLQGRGGISP